MKQDLYYWRLVATGLSYFTFGLGGLALRFILLPLFQLSTPDPELLQVRTRRLHHLLFSCFITLMRVLGVLTYSGQGIKAQLNKPGLLVVANHPTLIDVVFLISFMEQTNCIVRHGLFNNPFTGVPVRNARYISSKNAQEMISDCATRLKRGDSLIIFPEGTRTPMDSSLQKLHRGAANIAIQANVRPTPVKISCEPRTLSRGQKWYHIPLSKPHWTFEVGSPIDLPNEEARTKAARSLNRLLADYLSGEENSI